MDHAPLIAGFQGKARPHNRRYK